MLRPDARARALDRQAQDRGARRGPLQDGHSRHPHPPGADPSLCLFASRLLSPPPRLRAALPRSNALLASSSRTRLLPPFRRTRKNCGSENADGERISGAGVRGGGGLDREVVHAERGQRGESAAGGVLREDRA
eukprot:569113-Rhodomonas_salina.2